MELHADEYYVPCKHQTQEAAVLLWPSRLEDEDIQKRLIHYSRTYHVFLKRVRNLEDAIDICKLIKQNHKIKYLEFHGIGTATSIEWAGQILRVGLDQKQLSELFNLLESDATIVTLASQNGKGMVDYFAELAKGHLVIGHTGDLTPLTVKVKSLKPLVIRCYRYNIDITATKLN